MTIPRSHVVDPHSAQVRHVFNRCVPRAFLCGVDSISGRDREHDRKHDREHDRKHYSSLIDTIRARDAWRPKRPMK